MTRIIFALSAIALAGCGSAPPVTATVSGTVTATTVTCPSGTSNVQGTTCEETTARAATTQSQAETDCSMLEMHLCSIAERCGQFAHAPQEVAGTKYWLSDFTGGQPYVVEDGQPQQVNPASQYGFFCCKEGS